MNEDYNFIIKLVLLGDSSVGKTNLLLRYSKNQFEESTKATIGMDFISLESQIDQKEVRVQFWDTAGQEKYKAITRTYYRIAHGIVMVYDISKRNSFQRIQSWIDEIKTNCQSQPIFLLIGNKKDLQDLREVPTEEGKKFAEENEMFFFETSAKINDDNQVEKAFEKIILKCYEKIPSSQKSDKLYNPNYIDKSEIQVDEKSRSKKCCQFVII